MAEFMEFMKQAKRMCEAQEDCEECPIFPECGGTGIISWDDADEAETIEHKVMDWAAANPEPRFPTWEEWQKANFPDASCRIQPCRFMNKDELGCSEHRTCDTCRPRPIPADIAEKLGIKPIGGNENG